MESVRVRKATIDVGKANLGIKLGFSPKSDNSSQRAEAPWLNRKSQMYESEPTYWQGNIQKHSESMRIEQNQLVPAN